MGEHAAARTSLLEALAPHWKALWATFGTGIITGAVSVAPFSDGGAWWAVTPAEWQLIYFAVPGVGAVTWLAPKNRKPRRKRPAGGERVARQVRERGLI